MRSLKVLVAQPRTCWIGFAEPRADFRAFMNNRRWRQFAVSPSDARVFRNAIAARLRGVVKVGAA